MPALRTRHWLIGGTVQGVGFRPYVYRLAAEHGVSGFVRNLGGPVEIVATAAEAVLTRFGNDLLRRAPRIAHPSLIRTAARETRRFESFTIRDSEASGERRVHVPPDHFTCEDCLREIDDPADRRYRYPFINCTQCGPRYTLIGSLPYDRANTAMAGFDLCPSCAAEYRNPADRRFHAEPLACPLCGPRIHLREGPEPLTDDAALARAVERLRAGYVVAIRGIGGYHLACAAQHEAAVAHLRERKQRPHKPLAVMFPSEPSAPLAEAERWLTLEPIHRERLASARRPIVLCPPRRPPAGTQPLAEGVAAGVGEIGAMLPYSPLHHLLLRAFGAPLVMTSGNVSGEPVITEPEMAEQRLAAIADVFLHHDRPILRPADDSVERIVDGAATTIRCGRGMAPLELALPARLPEAVLAVGGQMKNSVALAWDDRLVLSPHIGDLDSPRAQQVFEQVCADLQSLYGVSATRVLCDLHPGYRSHRWARAAGLPLTTIQHHRAHASALALEGLDEGAIVFAWDGSGYGDDASLWGGETLLGRPGHWLRWATLRPFRLPGGERASREPWRSAAALCWETDWPGVRETPETNLLRSAWAKGLNAPASHAVGRLFDAAAALIGLCDRVSFEGQAPMWLEALCSQPARAEPLPLVRDPAGLWQMDWSPLLPVLTDPGLERKQRAAIFHETLAQTLLVQARTARREQGINQVGLCGGVFQNRVLTERATGLLREAGFQVVSGRRVPVNDGGISAGQVMEFLYT